jgi:hypothetical protein
MHLTQEVEWPESWAMDSWNKTVLKPKKILLFARDILECVSQQFLDPTIAFGWREHIQLEYEAFYTGGSDEQAYGNLASSEWMRKTQENIRATLNSTGKVLPLILYNDGVAVSPGSSVTAVLGTCGLFSDELQRKNEGKFSLGCISGLATLPIEALINHLGEKCNFSKARAVKSILIFSHTIDRQFWNMCLQSVRDHYRDGIQLQLLGDPHIHVFHPVVAFSVGDEVAQKRMCGIFAGHANRNCIHCLFPSNAGELYDPSKHKTRDHDQLAEYCEEAESILANEGLKHTNLHASQKQSSGAAKGAGAKNKKKKQQVKPANTRTDKEKAVVQELERQCVYPLANCFHSIPMGADNHVYKTPPDLFHVLPAGVMKHAVLWTCVIIVNIGGKDQAFNSAPGAVTFNTPLNYIIFV